LGYREIILADSPAAYWRLGETAGTTAADETGSHAGTYQGACTLGRPGAIASSADGALQVAGAGYVDLGNVLNATADMSVECWVKLSATGVHQDVVSKEGDGPASGYELGFAADNRVIWGVFAGTYYNIGAGGSGSLQISDTTLWHHLVGVRDSAAGLLRLYVDGVQVDTAACGPGVAASPQPLLLGAYPHVGAPSLKLSGYLDEVAIYAAALTAQQVRRHYTEGLASAGIKRLGVES